MFRGLLEWIIVEMRIPLRGGALRMPQQLTNNRQAKSRSGPHRRVGVAHIVDADAREGGTSRNSLPGFFKISARSVGSRAGNYVIAGSRQPN